ncbi:MAG: F0F1 ATP synthase subunit epsilon [Clostridia bacterium]|nr:F0F1 ATP synthase subunit epsilon [Clostridia bacterium]
METFKLRLYASDKVFYDDDAISISYKTIDGMYGVLAHHSNTIMAILPCTMKIVDKEENEIFAVVSDGIVKIENNVVLVLVENADNPEDVERLTEERRKIRAEEAKLQQRSNQEYAATQARLARAMNKLSSKNGGEESGQN